MKHNNGLGSYEEMLVREVGERIGYGRTMQLCEKIWNEKMPGAAHSTGPCVSMLVRCPCPVSGRDKNGHCEWCCGSGRVTRRVRAAALTEPKPQRRSR